MKEALPRVCLLAGALLLSSEAFAQTRPDTVKVVAVDSTRLQKQEKNRNVMLNADDNKGPRSVNIGLPFSSDISILENDVPVVYNFSPTNPIATWRLNNSLVKLGLLSFSESALIFGRVGFTVQSSDREATSSFKGYASVYGNGFGSSRYDVTLTGPIGKKGWGYMVSGFENYDRGNGTNWMFTPWSDRTQMVKAGITKKYDNGAIHFVYKYSNSKQQLFNFTPLIYEGDGKTRALDNFVPGRDSYVPRDGNIPYYNALTGAPAYSQMDDDNTFISHSFYINGSHKWQNDWKLTYSTMFQSLTGDISSAIPISLVTLDPDQQAGTTYTYAGTNRPYIGSVQYAAASVVRGIDSKYSVTRAEIAKQYTQHNLRFGTTYQYTHRQFEQDGGLFAHTVSANPERLDLYAVIPGVGTFKGTNEYGLFPSTSGGYGTITDEKFSKLALYGSDDIKVSNRLDIGLGARIERMTISEIKDPYINDFAMGRPFISHDFNNLWNKVGVASAVVKLTSKFGLLGDITYNSAYDRYWDYAYRDGNNNPMPDPATPTAKPLLSVPKTLESVVLNYGGGIYFNAGDVFSLVSRITKISKTNNRASTTITNPNNPGERQTFDPLLYDIETLGWTTDIVTNPFKGFNLHYLFTLQDPKYKNYDFGAFGTNYSYSNKTIPVLSKTLMEIDPSYSFLKGSLRAWVSVRYYGRQYGNPTNSFYFNGWFENFGGLDYRLNRNIDFKLQVTNFLDQKGLKGEILGADLVTDPSPYIGRKLSASAIRPRTLEFTANFKF